MESERINEIRLKDLCQLWLRWIQPSLSVLCLRASRWVHRKYLIHHEVRLTSLTAAFFLTRTNTCCITRTPIHHHLCTAADDNNKAHLSVTLKQIPLTFFCVASSVFYLLFDFSVLQAACVSSLFCPLLLGFFLTSGFPFSLFISHFDTFCVFQLPWHTVL